MYLLISEGNWSSSHQSYRSCTSYYLYSLFMWLFVLKDLTFTNTMYIVLIKRKILKKKNMILSIKASIINVLLTGAWSWTAIIWWPWCLWPPATPTNPWQLMHVTYSNPGSRRTRPMPTWFLENWVQHQKLPLISQGTLHVITSVCLIP